jgi:Flp pilus assembly protein TadG
LSADVININNTNGYISVTRNVNYSFTNPVTISLNSAVNLSTFDTNNYFIPHIKFIYDNLVKNSYIMGINSVISYDNSTSITWSSTSN